jgi:hypothetical protein
MWKRLHVKYPLFLSDLNETWNFWTDFRKRPISRFFKIRLVGAELFHAEGQTDMKLIVAFRNFFTKVSKKQGDCFLL